MTALTFYKGQLIEMLSRDELLNVIRELSRGLSPCYHGSVQMSKAEAIKLGLITPER